MRRSGRELWLALIAIIVITGIYLFMLALLKEIPPASGLFGHGIGILGFILMLMTETLYSFRKRSRSARWGRMSDWLEFHIFTGIVGPYMVLMHSSWKFNGIAGLVTLMTFIIVLSGFFGRYLYTSIPRTLDGVEMQAGEIESRIQAIEETLAFPESRPLASSSANAEVQLDRLSKQRDVLRRQLTALAMTRRLMALWHAVHVPLGLALFAAAFIHIAAAIYYATLLR